MRMSTKLLIGIVALFCARTIIAHPMVEAGFDVGIGREKITIDARIAIEEVLVAAARGGPQPPKDTWPDLVRAHGPYLLKHIIVKADGSALSGKVVGAGEVIGDLRDTGSAHYRLEYPVAAPPTEVRIFQGLLRDVDTWTVTCAVRIRQEGNPYEMALLAPEKTIAYDCKWSDGVPTSPSPSDQAQPRTSVNIGATIGAYLWHGIHHILTGYDHLLFVSALVLAATSFWDLIKVVTAFTVAHTATLTLSVFDIVHLSEHVVEPMIAASIVFVAVQNIFWPERSRGWTRLAIAFGFGLFHGLGFAGGLKEAMSGMPSVALWSALAAFSVGVEVGHQMVVLPLFASLSLIRHAGTDEPRKILMSRLVRAGSGMISIAGVWFLVQAVR